VKSTEIPEETKFILMKSDNNKEYNKKAIFNNKNNTNDLYKAFDNISLLFTEKDKQLTYYESKLKLLESQNSKLMRELDQKESEKKVLEENNFNLVKKIKKLNIVIEDDINNRKDSLRKSKSKLFKHFNLKLEFSEVIIIVITLII